MIKRKVVVMKKVFYKPQAILLKVQDDDILTNPSQTYGFEEGDGLAPGRQTVLEDEE